MAFDRTCRPAHVERCPHGRKVLAEFRDKASQWRCLGRGQHRVDVLLTLMTQRERKARCHCDRGSETWRFLEQV